MRREGSTLIYSTTTHSHNGQGFDGGRGRHDGGRVATHDGDHLVPVDLQTVVEADDDVVGEHASRFLH